MNNPTEFHDNTSYTKEELDGLVPTVVGQVSDRTLEYLENRGIILFPPLSEKVGGLDKDSVIIKSENGNYRIGNVVGFLGQENQEMIIRSRFSEGEKDYFFRYLLERVLDVPTVVDLPTSSPEHHEDKFFDLLAFMFPYYLKKALNQGLFKIYDYKEYNNDNIRGRIDIHRHIRTNIPFQGRVSYSKREISHDNYVTRLIYCTVESIKKRSYGSQLLKQVSKEVALINSEIDLSQKIEVWKILNDNKRRAVHNPIYLPYKELQELCIMILEQDRRYFDSDSHKVNGIIFDVAWLWEEYLNTLLSDDYYHPQNKVNQGGEHLFMNKSTGRVNGSIFPDFISKEKDNRIIIDAKYKPREGIGGRDYQQLLAYMFRFDSRQGMYIHPTRSGETTGDSVEEKIQELRLLSGSKNDGDEPKAREDISLWKYRFRIPSLSNTDCDTEQSNELDADPGDRLRGKELPDNGVDSEENKEDYGDFKRQMHDEEEKLGRYCKNTVCEDLL